MGTPFDAFDSTMFLGKTDDTVAGSYEAVPGKSSDSPRPSVIRYTGDGTAQLRSDANVKHNSSVPASSTEGSSYPGRVDEFNPINLTPGPKHPRAPKTSRGETGHGG